MALQRIAAAVLLAAITLNVVAAQKCTSAPSVSLPGGTWPSTCKGTSSGATCTGVCNAGYTPSSPAPSTLCSRGVWQTPSGKCNQVCQGLPSFTLANGQWAASCSNTVVGSWCAGTCSAGFMGTPKARCGAGGSWPTGAMEGGCVPVTCAGTPALVSSIGNGKWPDSCKSSAPGTTCTAICQMDHYFWYNKTGLPKSACQQDGTWSKPANPAYCERQKALPSCLGNPPAPANAAFSCGVASPPGSVCAATCAAGFAGSPSATCQINKSDGCGKWTAVTGSCRRVCSGNPPAPSNSKEFSCPQPAEVGSVCNTTCKAGYRGSPSATCQANSTYSAVNGNCTLIVCTGNPPNPDNGSFSCGPGPVLPGTVCNATCDANYRGSPSATCQADGTYGTVEGTCDRIMCTGNPPNPDNGAFTSCPSPVLPGAVCNATCNANYRGSPSATCKEDGTYGTVEGSCDRIMCTGNPPNPDNGAFTSCPSPVLPGAVCNATCDANYRGSPSATCQADGTYGTVEGTCDRIMCTGNPSNPTNGAFTSCPSPVLPGAVCNATCNTNYRGSPSATCQVDGTYGTVEGSCDLIQCTGSPQNPLNGAFACPSPVAVGYVCTATCNANYQGSPSATCQPTGTYTSVTGTCTSTSVPCVDFFPTPPAGTGDTFGGGAACPTCTTNPSVVLEGVCGNNRQGTLTAMLDAGGSSFTVTDTCTAFNPDTALGTLQLQYEFSGGSLSPTSTAGGTGSAITAGSGASAAILALVDPNVDPTPPLALGFTPKLTTQCISNAVSGNNYFEFTVTPNAGVTFRYIQIQAARGGASTPRTVEMRSSRDGYTDPLLHFPVETRFNILSNGDAEPFPKYTFKIPDVTAATTFRVYGFAPAATSIIDFSHIGFYG